MANKQVKNLDLSVLFMRRVYEDDVIGAKRLLVGIDEQGKKMIVSTAVNGRFPLTIAARNGNTAMVEFLVKDCHASTEEARDFNSETPLWSAAIAGWLKVVKLLQEYGADINAVSKDGRTPVNATCDCIRTEVAEFLIRQGADIHRPDKRGETCLMKSVHHLELCKLLIKTGACMNAQDNLGNTVLHHAIIKGRLQTVQLLLDRGSDQNIKNNQGDDALQLASLQGKDSIVWKLVARQKPTPSRWIESQQLLCSHCVLFLEESNAYHALVYWRRAVTLRMENPCTDSRTIEPSPVYMNTKEVSTMEELEELSQEEEMMHMYALENLQRILIMGHNNTIAGLVRVCEVFSTNGKYRRSFDLMRYSFQLIQQARTRTWIDDYLFQIRYLNQMCADEDHRSQYGIEFHDVFEILDTVSSNAQFVRQVSEYESFGMEPIVTLVQFVIKLDKSPDQMDSFKRIVRRLVRSKMKNKMGRTLLHRAVERCCLFRGWLSFVELLLECGADVNAVDRKKCTALHLCSPLHINVFTPNEREEVTKLLLRYSAHVDIFNDSGVIAAEGLELQILDHVNLKCLAATVIRDRRISYVSKIPAHLEPFVQMHGR